MKNFTFWDSFWLMTKWILRKFASKKNILLWKMDGRFQTLRKVLLLKWEVSSRSRRKFESFAFFSIFFCLEMWMKIESLFSISKVSAGSSFKMPMKIWFDCDIFKSFCLKSWWKIGSLTSAPLLLRLIFNKNGDEILNSDEKTIYKFV